MNELVRVLHIVVVWLPWSVLYLVVTIVILRVGCAMAHFCIRGYRFYVLTKEPKRCLELIPQASTDSNIDGMQQFLSMLSGFLQHNTIIDRLLHRKTVISLEMRSTRHGGIRYLVYASQPVLSQLVLYFASYMPSIQTRFLSTKEEITDHKQHSALLTYKQSGHFVYSLNTNPSTDNVDPLSYIHGAMSNLTKDEAMTVQLILSPLSHRSVGFIRSKIARNELLLPVLPKSGFLNLQPLVRSLHFFSTALSDSLTIIAHEATTSENQSAVAQTNFYQQVEAHTRMPRVLTRIERTTADAMHKKLSDDLYAVNIRTLTECDDPLQLSSRQRQLKNTLQSFRSTKDQSLKPKFTIRPLTSYNIALFRHRLPSLLDRNTSILSATELSHLFHFQANNKLLPEPVKQHRNPELSLPPAIKARIDSDEYDVLLGLNDYLGTQTPIGLTAKEREKHIFIIGGTGNGKSTMLQYMIEQDIAAGKGVAVIDPHGDLAQSLLQAIPEQRLQDVVYLNPVDIQYPVGINLLELSKELSEEAALLEKAKVSSSIISIFRKVFSEDSERAFRVEAVLRNTIQTALSVDDATLFTIPKLLRNSLYRAGVVARLNDDGLKDFWYEEIGRAGSMQVVNMTKSITQRIDHFKSSAHVYRMFGQLHSTIDFDDIINHQKILICNFGFGTIGEDEAILLGTTILAKLKLAAEHRIALPIDERQSFYTYVDEFQNFATAPFVSMLSSSRKYGLYLTMAEQSTRQQSSENLTETILANVGTVVCFRTGSHIDENLMIHKFEPYIEKHVISHLPSHHFLCRVRAEESFEPFTGVTLVPGLSDQSVTSDIVINASRANYARKYEPGLLGLKDKTVTRKSKRATKSK